MKRRTQLLQIGLLFCLVAGMFGLVQPAGAATLTVCPSIFCLYQTISSAVAAANPGDTITVGAGTYNEHDIVINQSLTITGDGSGVVTVDAGGAGRIFDIYSGVAAKISGMTVTNGSVVADNGGGILNNGSLTLNDVILTNNAAPSGSLSGEDLGGGIYSNGNLTITNSQVTNNSAGFGGGGIALGTNANATTTTLSYVQILNNTITGNNPPSPASAGGGGIFLWNFPGTYAMTLNIDHSSISNNNGDITGSGAGGGIEAGNATVNITSSAIVGNTADGGGGIFAEGGPALNLINDTFSLNQAVGAFGSGGGLAVYDDVATLTNVTVAGNTANNSGGIFNAGDTTVINLADTLVSNNVATASAPDCNAVTSLDYNLFQNPSGCSISGATTHNITGADPLLGPAALNGGPTDTMALAPGSPAIDAGNNNTCASIDQQGISRPVGAFCDIGAYEFTPNISMNIISAKPNPSMIGQNVLVSVSVRGGRGVPTGTVAITGASSNCTITLSDGKGKCSVTFAAGGINTLIATYSGDARHDKSTAALAHAVYYQLTFQPLASQDGWVLESAQGSNRGGSLDASGTTFQLGDDALNRQYRAILSFDTSSLPASAAIQGVELNIAQSGDPVGINPFTNLGNLTADIKTGFFDSSPALELADFNAAASVRNVGHFNDTPSSGWYSLTLNAAGRAAINLTGLTQFRLRFSKATNANDQADYMVFFGDNPDTTSLSPQLTVYYFLP